jgi:hypothetical protein
MAHDGRMKDEKEARSKNKEGEFVGTTLVPKGEATLWLSDQIG